MRRTEESITRHAGEVFFLNLPLSTGSAASQDGRCTKLEAGDFALVDSTRPFELDFSHSFRQISVAIPHEILSPLLAAPRDATAVRVAGNRGVGAVAAGAIRALASDRSQFSCHESRALTEQLAGLMALAVGAVASTPRTKNRGLLLHAAFDEMRRSHRDPALSPATVAERIGVSTSYLHKLFADRGTTFGRGLNNRRLEQCRRDLEDPARRHWTIGAIAHEHGFNDPSYFGRAFKARYGVTPKEHRNAARDDQFSR